MPSQEAQSPADRTELSRRGAFQLAMAATLAVAARAATDEEKVSVAIINRDRKWLNLESMATLERTFRIDIPSGKSPTIRKLRYKEVPFYYLTRYGDVDSGEIAATDEESFPGERSVQLWVTLMTLGVTNVLHGNLIGAIDGTLNLEDLVIVDDFIDLKPNHPQSVLPYFFKGKAFTDWKRWGTRMNPVLCPDLRRALYDEAITSHHAGVRYGGTLAQTHTDRWETPAEVRMLKTMGATVTCTLDGTYIVYAKQAGIHYATLQYVLNYGEGLRPNDVAMLSAAGMANVAVSMRKTMLDTVATLKDFKHECDCFHLEEERYRAIFPMTTR